MAAENLNGKVALRLFLLIVGTLFVWEAVPSTRWTYDLSPNIQTGLWKTCSCTTVDRNHCRADYSYLQGSYFWTKYGCTEQNHATVCGKGSAYDKEIRNNHQYQWLFKSLKESHRRDHHHEHGALSGVFKEGLTPELWDSKYSQERIYNRDKHQDCRKYLGSGAIALVSYISAFVAFLLVIKNIAANKVPVMDFGVFVFVLMSGVWGLIASALFGDVFGHNEGRFPLGHQYAIFTTAWALFFVVGVTGVSELRKGTASEQGSAVRSALFVAALVAFAYSMGNDWFVQDNQALIVPLGGFQWTLKAGTFFIAPAAHAPYINDASLEHFYNNKRSRHQGKLWCNYTADDASLRLKNPNANLDHLAGSTNPSTVYGTTVEEVFGPERRHKEHKDNQHYTVTDQREHKENNRNHYPDQCILPAQPTLVSGQHVVGPWHNCYCKRTTSLSCNLFGSSWPMLNGRTMKCNELNVARAMILLVGIFSFLSLTLSSVLIGGLRRQSLHLLSNNFAILASILGLISSVLFGAVVYDRHRLSADFAIYLAGWWLIFLAGVLGVPITSYYGEVENSGKVIPLQTLA